MGEVAGRDLVAKPDSVVKRLVPTPFARTRPGLIDPRSRSRKWNPALNHALFQYAAFELPEHAGQIQRVLAIPSKRCTHQQVGYLTRPEVDALLAAPDRGTIKPVRMEPHA